MNPLQRLSERWHKKTRLGETDAHSAQLAIHRMNLMSGWNHDPKFVRREGHGLEQVAVHAAGGALSFDNESLRTDLGEEIHETDGPARSDQGPSLGPSAHFSEFPFQGLDEKFFMDKTGHGHDPFMEATPQISKAAGSGSRTIDERPFADVFTRCSRRQFSAMSFLRAAIAWCVPRPDNRA